MTVPNRVIPASNLPPQSQDWGRKAEAAAVKNRDDLNALAQGAGVDQGQLNTAINGVGEWAGRVRTKIKSFPGGYIYSMTLNAPSIPANSWTTWNVGTFAVPANKNRAMIYALANVTLHLAGDGTQPAARARINTGVGSQIEVPLQGRNSLANESYRFGSITSVGAITNASQSTGTMTPSFSLWTAKAFPPDAETIISFNVHFLYGGQV